MWLQFPELTLRKISTALREAELRKLSFLWFHPTFFSLYSSHDIPLLLQFTLLLFLQHPSHLLITASHGCAHPTSSLFPCTKAGQFLLCPAPSHSCAGFLDIWPQTDPSRVCTGCGLSQSRTHMGTSLSLCPQLTSQIWVEQVSLEWEMSRQM